ncbi:D-glycero-alpha-D-manno-heptose-1,7-bisphosphate 7-phosphatase [Tenggerimyces flavus]|uniref:D-glycero-alpha-D-manno-heptose-1,7-bisphosphate 7-phosphatase n=1 Tax=Tenggerimyces flavus TaxID=1708749 RepID=UPI0036DAB67B
MGRTTWHAPVDRPGPLASISETASRSGAKHALVCDRDGVIVENRRGYILRPRHLRLLPGAVGALRLARAFGALIVIVSNQAAVGHGLLSEVGAMRLHTRLLGMLMRRGVDVAASFLCPHAPRDRCPCRKPASGMIEEALSALALKPADCFLVGDALTDLMAGRAADLRSGLVLTGRGHEQLASVSEDHPVFADLEAAARFAVGLWTSRQVDGPV